MTTRRKKKASRTTPKRRAKRRVSKASRTTPKRRAKRRVTKLSQKSSLMRKIDELNNEARRSINAAKTARNSARAAKDVGIRRLYNAAVTHHVKLAKEAQKKALELMKKAK